MIKKRKTKSEKRKAKKQKNEKRKAKNKKYLDFDEMNVCICMSCLIDVKHSLIF